MVRRIEMYTFTGTYDPVTHAALCADLLCNAPSVGELGDLESAQMTAALVQQNNITIARNGLGTVSSTDKLISCDTKCTAAYVAGTMTTLTAVAASGSVFTGWTGACTTGYRFAGWCGACSGTGSCNVILNANATVQANFTR